MPFKVCKGDEKQNVRRKFWKKTKSRFLLVSLLTTVHLINWLPLLLLLELDRCMYMKAEDKIFGKSKGIFQPRRVQGMGYTGPREEYELE